MSIFDRFKPKSVARYQLKVGDQFHFVSNLGRRAIFIAKEPMSFATREDALRSLVNETDKWSGDAELMVDSFCAGQLGFTNKDRE